MPDYWTLCFNKRPKTDNKREDYLIAVKLADYLERFIARGLLKNGDKDGSLASLIIDRWLLGKRAYTLPGTLRAKKNAKALRQFLKAIPPDVDALVDTIISDNPKAVADYRAGKTKAAGVMIGMLNKSMPLPNGAASHIITSRLDTFCG